MNSTSVDDLHPFVAEKARRFIGLCEDAGVQVLVFSTRRDRDDQAARYAIGRTVPGPGGRLARPLGWTITADEPGASLHELGLAFDCCPLLCGMPVMGVSVTEWPMWRALRRAAMDPRVNLQWATHQKGGTRRPWHFFYTGGYSIEELFAGAKIATP